MTRKLWSVFVLSLLLISFLAVSTYGMSTPAAKKSKALRADQMPIFKLAGAERNLNYVPPPPSGSKTLGFEGPTGNSPGIIVGYSTYDYQHNGRMGRLVGHRGIEMVHFDWMKQTDSTLGGNRGTGYEAWDEEIGEFVLAGLSDGGGCDIHARLGSGVNYSGYVTLDVDTEGKVVICNHHDGGAEWSSTVWYDFLPAACYFNPYTERIPDSVQWYYALEGPDPEMIWPSMEYQVWDGDTVTHVFAQQANTGGPGTVTYFRRPGSDTVSTGWEYPPWCIDTIPVLAHTVTASRVSGRVALVWNANLPEVTGDGESVSGGSQYNNDVYYAMSTDMGVTWGTAKGVLDKFNITKSDKTMPGWRAYTDISCLIGTDDYLHVIWAAREWSPNPPPGGTYTRPNGSRLFHWDENTAEIRVVKDANWEIPEGSCTGGAWNNMSITKMSISECDGKFYAMFVQHQRIDEGVYDDCHAAAYTAGATAGTSNGELFISVSDNGGYNWDIARNLTNTYTPSCNHKEDYVCDADNWPSMARFGMEVTYGDFTGVPVVDPSGGYVGNFFLDIFYVNDIHPSACVQNLGVWTYNPFKWFRVPCVNPVPNPVLAVTPAALADPVWTKPGIPLDTTIKLENIGNAPLNIDSIIVVEINGAGWLARGTPPTTISHLSPNFYDLAVTLNLNGSITTSPFVAQGSLDIYSDNASGMVSYKISLIVADTVYFPEYADIRTECTRLIFNNAGNMGNGGNPPDGGYNLGFLDDCDTTNATGANDNAPVYLYDGSPFLLRVDDQGDTVLTSSIFDADWLSKDGFRPLEGPSVDSTTYADYQYGYTGRFGTRDTSIILEIEYFAPKNADSCEFIVMKQRIYNNTNATITGVYVGDMFDWDIPSDTTVRNLSGFDAGRDLMYCQGWETGQDTLQNGDPDMVNDCVLADERLAGMAFYNGFKLPYRGAEDSLDHPAGPWWTALNADYLASTGGFVGKEIGRKIQAVGGGFEAWSSEDPDSIAYDLHMVAVTGQFDIGENDTLVFVKILVTENGQTKGLANLQATVDRAKTWIALRPEIFTWPEVTGCCDTPGDANNSGGVNILDVTKIINYLYKGADPPPCNDEADANGSNGINILDVTRIINYLYKGGDAPVCGTTGT